MSQPRIAAGSIAGAAAAGILALATPLIQREEGRRTVAYLDPVKIVTICDGHTEKGLKLGEVRSNAQCDALLDADERAALRRMQACTAGEAPRQVWAAMTSFSFNVGTGVYCTRFAPLIVNHELAAACAKLSLYTYAGGRPLPGLIRRRAAERALCESGLK